MWFHDFLLYFCTKYQLASLFDPRHHYPQIVIVHLIDVWIEVAGIRKGRIYGLGSESSLFASRQNYCGSSSSSTEWVQKHEFEKLEFERVELRDMVKQLMKSLNFQPKPYIRDQVHEDDVVDDNKDIIDNNDDNEDVVDNNDDNSDDNDGMSDDDKSE
ncbi:hypothetical protein P8452_60782 [Trifolium repens]|nr:hypothetical protein P8452_60782 [Trifolium repens]